MSQLQWIFLSLLSIALLGAIGLAFVGVKRMRAMASPEMTRGRFVVYSSLVGALAMLIASGAGLMAAITHEPPINHNWGLFLSFLAVGTSSLFMAASLAWQQVTISGPARSK